MFRDIVEFIVTWIIAGWISLLGVFAIIALFGFVSWVRRKINAVH